MILTVFIFPTNEDMMHSFIPDQFFTKSNDNVSRNLGCEMWINKYEYFPGSEHFAKAYGV